VTREPAERTMPAPTPDSHDGPAAGVPIPERIAGRRWVARADCVELVRFIAEKLDTLRRLPGCSIIKESTVRTVYRLQADGGRDLIVKHYRSRGLRDAMKFLFVRTKARAEWRAARRMAVAGIRVPAMIAVAEKRTGPFFRDASLAMDAIAGAFPPLGLLQQGRQMQRDVLDQVADLVALMHRHRILHTDFHTGNLLAVQPPGGLLELHVIDLHAVRFPLWLTMSDRAGCLALLVQSLTELVEQDDLERMCRRYAQRAGLDDSAARRLWMQTRRQAARNADLALSRRIRHCLKNSSKFAVERIGGLKVFRARSAAIDEIRNALREYRERQARGTSASASGISALGQPERVQEWRGWRRRSHARAAWVNANGLVARGASAPEPVALVHETRFGGSSFLITTHRPAAGTG